jgi:hypothetical protein
MSPALGDGDEVHVAPFGDAPPRPGEVVVARLGPRLVTHRLRRLDGGRAILRGDACRHDDPPLPLDALLGRVVAVRPLSRWRRWWRR